MKAKGHSRRMLTFLLSLAALLALPGAAQAATITVTDAGDGASASACTLRQAIEDANNTAITGLNNCATGAEFGTDTINFSALFGSAQTIPVGSALPSITSDINIAGPGASLLDVNRNAAITPYRIFTINGSPTVTISGLKVSNGLADSTNLDGGGILVNGAGANVTLSALEISGNNASETNGSIDTGGGVSNNGTLHVVQSTISGNTASGSTGAATVLAWGGGIYNEGGATLTVDNSTISGNNANAAGSPQSSAEGGGIFNDGGSVTVDHSTITANHATATSGSTKAGAGGGGIYSQFSPSAVTVRRSTIDNNSATASGSTTENTAVGGGIDANSGGTNAFDRVTVTQNSVSATGTGAATAAGGIELDSNGTVTSSTLTENTSPASGGNIANGTLKNTIVANPHGGADNCGGTVTSAGHNLEYVGTASCNFSAGMHDLIGVDPLFVSLGVLANYGGPTKTIALQTTPMMSPAIDAGLGSAGETTDQRGLSRPLDFFSIPNASSGNGADIGAFEVQPTSPPGTKITSHSKRRTHSRHATVHFTNTSIGPATFQCRINHEGWKSCHSAKRFHLKVGKNTFRVRAIAGGLTDSSPAEMTFKRLG